MYCDTIFESECAEERIIGFLALLGYATKGQLQAICLGSEAAIECDNTINRLVNAGMISVFPSRLPKQMGGKQVDVFCLTRASRHLISQYLPGLDHKFARLGIPETVNLARVPHELIVTEAVLWYAARGKVLAFMPENALRSAAEKKRIKQAGGWRKMQQLLISEPDAAPNLNLSDFEILVKYKNETKWLSCEAAIRYDVKDIGNKPRGLAWFVPGIMQAQKVALYAIKEQFQLNLTIIGDVSRSDSRAGDAQPVDQTSDRTLPEKRNRKAFSFARSRAIKNWLEKFPCGLTTDALSVIMKAPRNHLTSVLRQMEQAQTLSSDRGQLMPGYSRGNAYQVYTLRSLHEPNVITEENVQRIQHAVFLSRCIVQANEEGFVIEKYITSNGAFLFSRTSGSRFLVICDDRSRSIVDLAERYYRAIKQNYAQDRHVMAAVVDDNIGSKEENPLLFRLQLIQKTFPEWDYWYINSVAKARAKGAGKLGL